MSKIVMLDENLEDLPLYSSLDAAIVMHRDAHFGGQFDIMLQYYMEGGKGVDPEFDVKRIKELAHIEKDLKENLAGVILTGPDAERVADAKKAYKTLRDLYDVEKPLSKTPLLIADLILSESEDADDEIDALVKEKGLIVPALIDLIKSENFHDPLFPGYGKAPTLAMKCLGKIGDKKAIITLFESIGSGDFFDEDIALQALRAIGEPAKQFLLKVLRSKPVNIDNEKAAIALIAFKEDPEVAKECISMLHDPQVLKDIPLATYIILACEGITDHDAQQQFKELLNNPNVPKAMHRDIESIIKTFA